VGSEGAPKWWSRAAEASVCLVILLLAAAASFNGFYDKWGFREGSPRFSPEMMLGEDAYRPFIFRQFNIVIANAGFGVVGNAADLELADYRRQFETNVFGVIRTLHESLDALRRTRGRFVIMGSAAGHLSTAWTSPYSMSKFAVRALAEALHGELRPAGVSCTLISPGFVDSDIRRVDNGGALHAGAEDPIPAWLRMKTDDAARVIARGILRGKKEVIVTTHAKVLVFLTRHLPRLTRWVSARPRGPR